MSFVWKFTSGHCPTALTWKTNFYNQKTNFPIYSNTNCLICDSILIIKKLNNNNKKKMRSTLLWMEFLENVISLDSLKTLSAIHLYKIKWKLISNSRSI